MKAFSFLPQGCSLPKYSEVHKLSLRWSSSANRVRQSLGKWLCNQPLLTPFCSRSHFPQQWLLPSTPTHTVCVFVNALQSNAVLTWLNLTSYRFSVSPVFLCILPETEDSWESTDHLLHANSVSVPYVSLLPSLTVLSSTYGAIVTHMQKWIFHTNFFMLLARMPFYFFNKT